MYKGDYREWDQACQALAVANEPIGLTLLSPYLLSR